MVTVFSEWKSIDKLCKNAVCVFLVEREREGEISARLVFCGCRKTMMKMKCKIQVYICLFVQGWRGGFVSLDSCWHARVCMCVMLCSPPCLDGEMSTVWSPPWWRQSTHPTWESLITNLRTASDLATCKTRTTTTKHWWKKMVKRKAQEIANSTAATPGDVCDHALQDSLSFLLFSRCSSHIREFVPHWLGFRCILQIRTMDRTTTRRKAFPVEAALSWASRKGKRSTRLRLRSLSGADLHHDDDDNDDDDDEVKVLFLSFPPLALRSFQRRRSEETRQRKTELKRY